jgi:hypothetical protein
MKHKICGDSEKEEEIKFISIITMSVRMEDTKCVRDIRGRHRGNTNLFLLHFRFMRDAQIKSGMLYFSLVPED